MDRKHIISEIIRTAKENNGVPLGKARFEKLTGIRFSDWYGKFWTKWGDAVKEAGFEPNQFNVAYDQDFLIETVISLINELEKFPTQGEIRLKEYNTDGFPSHNAIRRGLGKKREMAQVILTYCEGKSGYENIIDICKRIVGNPIKKKSENSKEDDSKFGYVYLMKSGRYYKIGKSDCVEKRNYEIGIKLPQKLKLIHKIKTDDPFGIEAYWHKRFENKRTETKGEWFDLSLGDVKAFKRRMFM